MQEIFKHFNRQFTKLDNASKELLDNTSRALKEAVETKGATKGIAMEVSKVTKTADKLTSKTGSYRDALLASLKQSNTMNADLRVLSVMDRKAKQILINVHDMEGKNTLEKSL